MSVISRGSSLCAVAILALVVTSGAASADGLISGTPTRIVTCASLLSDLEACSAQKVADLRITSYNVCYTKLLHWPQAIR